MKTKNELKAIDFFCGGGGMTCGLRQAGINVLAGVDLDVSCRDTYEYNNAGSKFIQANIKTLDLDFFEKKFNVQKNDDNLIFVGCSPCQYYSIINTSKQKSLASKDLLMDFKRFIQYYNPGYVLVENVPGIVTNKDSVLPDFLDFLDKHHYKHGEYKIIDMSYYGVPQTRKRFSLIFSRHDPLCCLPKPEPRRSLLRECIGIKNGFLPIPAGFRDSSDFNHTVAKLSPICLKRLEKTPHNGGTRQAWKDDKDLQLKCFVGKDTSFRDTFGRMWWDRPAPTITTKFYSISNGRFAHPDENRAISIREGATIQTFPKGYIFKTKNLITAARLIGNAVPPEYARRLGTVIVRNQGAKS